MNLHLRAKILEFEVLNRMANVQDVISWADQEILKTECPSISLCDLSISKDEEDILKILESLSSKDFENEAFEYVGTVLSKKYINKELDFFEVVNKLIVMHYHSSELSNDNLDFCIWVDDEASLIAEGVKELKPAEEELSGFLAKLEVKQA